jgi:Flp pilus assembly protein TadG
MIGFVNRRARAGQGTVEFALMLPLAFALVFAVIEYSYFLGAVHYTNYATFAGARALQANADVEGVQNALLTGNVTRVATLLKEGEAAVRGRLPWQPQTPGFKGVFDEDMTVEMTVVLGPPECGYEGLNESEDLHDVSHPGIGDQANSYTDNGLDCGGEIP